MKKLVWLLSMVMMFGVFSLNAQEKKISKKDKTEQTQMKSDKPVKKGKMEKTEKAASTDKIVAGKKGPEGQTVYEGAKGGQYYINKNGNKTYLKK